MTISLAAMRRVSIAEFDRATSLLSHAEAEAARITGAAQAAADAADTDLNLRIADFEHRLHETEEKEFQAQLNLLTIIRRAEEAVALMDEAARFRAEVSAITPWLIDLVESCVRRIIGKLDASDVLAATVAEAVAEFKAKTALHLRVAAVDHDAVQAMILAHPKQFAAIAAVTPDANLLAGTIYLEGRGGFADISIAAQIAALMATLEKLYDDAVAIQ